MERCWGVVEASTGDRRGEQCRQQEKCPEKLSVSPTFNEENFRELSSRQAAEGGEEEERGEEDGKLSLQVLLCP